MQPSGRGAGAGTSWKPRPGKITAAAENNAGKGRPADIHGRRARMIDRATLSSTEPVINSLRKPHSDATDPTFLCINRRGSKYRGVEVAYLAIRRVKVLVDVYGFESILGGFGIDKLGLSYLRQQQAEGVSFKKCSKRHAEALGAVYRASTIPKLLV